MVLTGSVHPLVDSKVYGDSPAPEDLRKNRWVGKPGLSAEVARTVPSMSLHEEELKAGVGVRELHDQLSRYLRHVGAGGKVVVTMRGRRIARLSMVDGAHPLADLRARGLVRDPQRSRRRASGRELLLTDGSVSDLVREQRH